MQLVAGAAVCRMRAVLAAPLSSRTSTRISPTSRAQVAASPGRAGTLEDWSSISLPVVRAYCIPCRTTREAFRPASDVLTRPTSVRAGPRLRRSPSQRYRKDHARGEIDFTGPSAQQPTTSTRLPPSARRRGDVFRTLVEKRSDNAVCLTALFVIPRLDARARYPAAVVAGKWRPSQAARHALRRSRRARVVAVNAEQLHLVNDPIIIRGDLLLPGAGPELRRAASCLRTIPRFAPDRPECSHGAFREARSFATPTAAAAPAPSACDGATGACLPRADDGRDARQPQRIAPGSLAVACLAPWAHFS